MNPLGPLRLPLPYRDLDLKEHARFDNSPQWSIRELSLVPCSPKRTGAADGARNKANMRTFALIRRIDVVVHSLYQDLGESS